MKQSLVQFKILVFLLLVTSYSVSSQSFNVIDIKNDYEKFESNENRASYFDDKVQIDLIEHLKFAESSQIHFENQNQSKAETVIETVVYNSIIAGCVGAYSKYYQLSEFEISGSNVKDTIFIKVPHTFEISTNSNTGFVNLLKLVPVGGKIINTFVYVRATPLSVNSKFIEISVYDKNQIYATIQNFPDLYAKPYLIPKNFIEEYNEYGIQLNLEGLSDSISWINDNPSIGLPATGGDYSSLVFATPQNTNEDTLIANVWITPYITYQGCTGDPTKFSIKIVPEKAHFLVDESASREISYCKGDLLDADKYQSFIVVTSRMREKIIITTKNNFEVSLFPNHSFTDSLVFLSKNRDIELIEVFVRFTNTLQAGTIRDSVFIQNKFADKVFTKVYATVSELPERLTIENMTFIHGDTLREVSLLPHNQMVNYEWVNEKTEIGLGKSGTGQLPVFKATNLSKEPIVSTINFYPKYLSLAIIPLPELDSITIIDVNNFKKFKTIRVGRKPEKVVIVPSRKNAYILNTNSKDISVVSLKSFVETANINLKSTPLFATVNQTENRLFVISETVWGNNLIEIDLDSNKVVHIHYAPTNVMAMLFTSDENIGILAHYDKKRVNVFQNYNIVEKRFKDYYVEPDSLTNELVKLPNSNHLVGLSVKRDAFYNNNQYFTLRKISLNQYENFLLGYFYRSKNPLIRFLGESNGYFYMANNKLYLNKLFSDNIKLVDAKVESELFEVYNNKFYVFSKEDMNTINYSFNQYNLWNGNLEQSLDLSGKFSFAKEFMYKAPACKGQPNSFTITVYPKDYPIPNIQLNKSFETLGNCSTKTEVKQFLLSGNSLTKEVVIESGTNVEISLEVNGPFKEKISLDASEVNLKSVPVYFRFNDTATKGNFYDSISVSSERANKKFLKLQAFNYSIIDAENIYLPDAQYKEGYNQYIGDWFNEVSLDELPLLPQGLTISESGYIKGSATVLSETTKAYPIHLTEGYCKKTINLYLKVIRFQVPILLSNQSLFYNGKARPVNLDYSVTKFSPLILYNGKKEAPVYPGTYTVSVSIDNNYEFGYAESQIIIKKAELVFAADDLNRQYLEQNPQLTYKIEGLVNGENADVLDVSPKIYSEATINSLPGSYKILFTQGQDNNYDFYFRSGYLHILKVQQKITIEEINGKTIYDKPFKIKASATSGLPIEFRRLSGPIEIIGDVVVIKGDYGDATILAQQNGNEVFDYSSATLNFYIDFATNIEPSIKSNFKIFPNPVNNLLFIQNENYLKPFQVSIIDQLGRTIIEDTFENLSELNAIPVQNLDEGIYRIVLNGKEFRHISTFVKH